MQERGRGAKSWKYKTQEHAAIVDGTNVKEFALSWEGGSDATGQDVVDALSREEKRTERELANDLTAYLQARGGTAPQEDCKKALGFPKANWQRVREKAGVGSDVQSGGGGKGSSSAVWVLTSENTGTAAKTVTVAASESTFREYTAGTQCTLGVRTLGTCPETRSKTLPRRHLTVHRKAISSSFRRVQASGWQQRLIYVS